MVASSPWILRHRSVLNWKNAATSVCRKVPPPSYFPYILLAVLVLITATLNMSIIAENEFSVLSEQFLKGRLYLPSPVGDAVLYKGSYFWHLGPFPALLLVPFSFFTLGIYAQPLPQGLANIVFIGGALYLA